MRSLLNSTPLLLATIIGIPGAARCTVAMSTKCRCCAVWLKSLFMHALLCRNAQQIQSTEPWMCHPDDLWETIIPALLLCWDLHVDMVTVCKEHIEHGVSELSLPNMWNSYGQRFLKKKKKKLWVKIVGIHSEKSFHKVWVKTPILDGINIVYCVHFFF